MQDLAAQVGSEAEQGTDGVLSALDDEIDALQSRVEALLAEKERLRLSAVASTAVASPTLFPWQERALGDWRVARRRGVVQAVTGAGKTRVGVAAIAEALTDGRRAVVIVPTLVLVRQWQQTLGELLPGVAIATHKDAGGEWSVLVTTVHTAMSRMLLQRGESALVVADECHRYGAGRFADALYPQFGWRLGLTATLQREDDGDALLGTYFGGIVHDLGYREAVADGLIAPFLLARVSVPLTPRERRRYDELTDDLQSARLGLVGRYGVPAEPVGEFLREVSRLAEDRSSAAGGLARFYMARFSARRQLLAETEVKQEVLRSLAPVVRSSAGAVVFTQTKESSVRAAQILAETGCGAVAVHSELDQESREERIELLREGAVAALTAPRILDEGVDLPDADLGIVLSANRSRRQMVQRLGRVLRRREGKLARFVVLHAQDTVEDPRAADGLPDFYEMCAPFAQQRGAFDIGRGKLGDLVRFLGGDRAAVDEAVAIHDARTDDADTPEAPREQHQPTGARITQTPPMLRAPEDARALPTPDSPAPATVPGASGTQNRSEGPTELAAPDDPVELLAGVRWDGDLIRFYLHQIGRYPLLTAEQEVELAKAIEAGLYAGELLRCGDDRGIGPELAELTRRGAEAMDRMICANLRLVVSLAKRNTGRGMEFLDLIQEGNLGLFHTVEMFDHTKGNKFSTYATWWIRQALTRAVADKGRTIRIPVHFHELMGKVNRHRMAQGLGWRELLRTHPDGLPELEVNRTDLVRVAKLHQPLVSIDALFEVVEDSADLRPIDAESVGPESSYELFETRQDCLRLLEELAYQDARAAFVLRARFGFLTGEPETLEGIGARLGVTRERIRQIEKFALQWLRDFLRDAPGADEHADDDQVPAAPAEMPSSPPPPDQPAPRRAALDAPSTPVESAAPRRALISEASPPEPDPAPTTPEPRHPRPRLIQRSALGPNGLSILMS